MSKLEAINGTVFVIRDEMEDSVGGIEVSDRAKVGSTYGTIAAIGDCDYAKVGDRVHIPHYGVTDIEHDGKEYAMFKQDRLFFVNGDVVNGYALMRKCANDHVRDDSGEIALYMTDNHIDFTNWVEVIEVAEDCKFMKKDYVGMFCVAPEDNEKLARVGNSKDYCLHESLIQFLVNQK